MPGDPVVYDGIYLPRLSNFDLNLTIGPRVKQKNKCNDEARKLQPKSRSKRLNLPTIFLHHDVLLKMHNSTTDTRNINPETAATSSGTADQEHQ